MLRKQSATKAIPTFTKTVSSKKILDLIEQLEKNPIAQFTDEAFAKIIDEYSGMFKEFCVTNTLFSPTSRDGLHEKLAAILLVMKLMAVLEQKDFVGEIGDIKRQAVENLIVTTAPIIVNALNTINDHPEEWNKIHDIVLHQRLLMIENLLFLLAYHLKQSSNSALDVVLLDLPLEMNKVVLEKSKQMVVNRKQEGISLSELCMNKVFLAYLRDPSFKYHALKERAESIYVDKDSGLELDFPLANKVDIEYDGQCHYIDGHDNVPTLDQLRKMQQLQELSYHRISLNPSLVEKFDNKTNSHHPNKVEESSDILAEFIKMPGVVFYFDQSLRLGELRDRIRNEIKNIQHDAKKKLNEIRDVVQLSKKNKHEKGTPFDRINRRVSENMALQGELNKIKLLLDVENKIRDFYARNTLQKTLELVDINEIFECIENSRKIYALNERIQRLEVDLDATEKRLEVVDHHLLSKQLKQAVRHSLNSEHVSILRKRDKLNAESEKCLADLKDCDARDREFFENHLKLSQAVDLLMEVETEFGACLNEIYSLTDEISTDPSYSQRDCYTPLCSTQAKMQRGSLLSSLTKDQSEPERNTKEAIKATA